MNVDPLIEQYVHARGLSRRDALQTFMQVVVLRHLTLSGTRLIGGTALVLGYNNPRFSEDIDLTQVPDLRLLAPGLRKAASELEKWFGKKLLVTPPSPKGRTWQISCHFTRAETVRLHIDSQPQPAYTVSPIVIEFPSLPPLVCESVSFKEIMADKVIAVACRNYLGGRDLFDLWFHWLRRSNWQDDIPEISNYVRKKREDRRLDELGFTIRLTRRLKEDHSLMRAQAEWKRYLPLSFQTREVQDAMLSACQRLPEIFL
ncbi:MAG: nucleotidyl transferase AbiEii/AbiGii toxin family protein [Deltaproteobacteria bacterium]|nr:nucleotidyl transferase AbiEii/AbiGii toxin family protein [Deltaproteobacteria bacterium]